MIGIIVAMNSDRVIGVGGKIPWYYPGDLARFKRVTLGSTVIMGRKTWESIPERFRPLKGRTNVVLTENLQGKSVLPDGAAWATDIKEALAYHEYKRKEALERRELDLRYEDVWFIGGARVYTEAMAYADVIDVTHVPWFGERDTPLAVLEREQVRFPALDEEVFCPMEIFPHTDDSSLTIQRFERRYGDKGNARLQELGLLRRSR